MAKKFIYENIKDIPIPEGITVEYDDKGNPIRYMRGSYRICAAKCTSSTRVGKICTRKASTNGRCHMHGGNLPSGMDHANFRHGSYSKYLPRDILDRFEKALDDTELVSLRQNLALTDVRLTQLLERMETGDTLEYWRRLRDWYSHFQKLDQEDQYDLLPSLKGIIDGALNDYAVWKEIQKTSEEKRKLAESERKRLIDMQQYVTAERAMMLITATIEIVRKYVEDPAILNSVSSDISRLISQTSSRGSST